jgi:hypothetical protein
MKLNKIAPSTYSFKDAVVSSVYDKTEKNFIFSVERIGYYTTVSTQKNILVMSNEIEKIYNSMNEVDNSIDIDWDLSEDQAHLVKFIRSFNPMEHEITSVEPISEIQDEVLIALNKYLETKADEDYAQFREILDWECAQDLAEELVIA